MNWKEHNQYELKEVADVFSCVRLVNISVKDLETMVRPASVYPELVVSDAIEKGKDSHCLEVPRGNIAGKYYVCTCVQ